MTASQISWQQSPSFLRFTIIISFFLESFFCSKLYTNTLFFWKLNFRVLLLFISYVESKAIFFSLCPCLRHPFFYELSGMTLAEHTCLCLSLLPIFNWVLDLSRLLTLLFPQANAECYSSSSLSISLVEAMMLS